MPIFAIFLAAYIFGFSAGFVYAVFSFILVLAMSVSQYLKLIPHFHLFNLPEAHWRNTQYLVDYMTGMFELYLASAFSIGLLTRLAAQRAERVNGYREKLESTSVTEAEAKEKIRQANVEILVKGAELERLQAQSAERQLKLIELKKEVEELRGGG
jgi:hypothetical protein